MATIDLINSNILRKCNILTNVDELFTNHDIKNTLSFSEKANDILREYNLGSVMVLTDFFTTSGINKDSNTKRLHYLNEFNTFIQSENIIGRLDDVYHSFRKYALNLPEKQSKAFFNDFNEICRAYDETSIRYNVPLIAHETCNDCKCKMQLLTNTSEIQCNKCGLVKEIRGMVFDEDQLHPEDRQKYGSYDPTKHCRFWIERIQAKEFIEIDINVIEQIKKCIVRDNITCKRKITCSRIRRYIKETKNSAYNEHVPLIRKIITGIAPPQLTDVELQLINNYFAKIIRIFDETKPSKKINCPYHPYFIYKIIEQMIHPQKGGKSTRKCEILSCIHLQSRDTLIENDRIWKPICEKIPGFIYMPTDRNLQEIDY